jgi:methionine-rich copper-binding protein CopC
MNQIPRYFFFGLMASVALAGQAFAHAHLNGAVPADKTTVAASPAELDLSFSEEVNLAFSGIKLIGPGKTDVKTGDASLKDSDKTLAVPLTETLGAGSYTVEWHALSTDGHKTSGSYSFTVKP